MGTLSEFKEWTKVKKSSFQYPVGGQMKKNKNGCPEFCSASYQKSSPIYITIIDEYIKSNNKELSTKVSNIISDLQQVYEENVAKIEKDRTEPPTNLPKLLGLLSDYNRTRELHNEKKSELMFQTPAQNRGVQKLLALGMKSRKFKKLETNLSNLEPNISENVQFIVKKIQPLSSLMKDAIEAITVDESELDLELSHTNKVIVKALSVITSNQELVEKAKEAIDIERKQFEETIRNLNETIQLREKEMFDSNEIIEKIKKQLPKKQDKIKHELEEQKKSSKSKFQAQFNEVFEISDEEH